MDQTKKIVRVGLYILMICYLIVAIYFLLKYGSYQLCLLFGLMAFIYEKIAKSIDSKQKGWLLVGIFLLSANVLDGVSLILNIFVFKVAMSYMTISIHVITAFVSLLILPMLLKVRRSIIVTQVI